MIEALVRRAAGLIAFIVARPGLDAFVRRQVYRFPRLAARMRMAVTDVRRPQQEVLVATDPADLTDAARQILADLARSMARRPR